MAVDIPIDVQQDEVLVRRHLHGEPKAFDELFDRYYTRLTRYCLRRVGDRATAEDITQETLLQALRYLERFDLKRPMWPWLKTIAGHEIGNLLEIRSEEQPGGDTCDALFPSIQDQADLLVEKDLLRRALNVLRPSHRTAIKLRYFEDWSPEELASFLGISKHAVEQLLCRARAKLREEYERLSRGARERIGLLFPPFLRLRTRLRQLAGRLRGDNELLGAGLTGPLASSLVGLAAAGVAIGLLTFSLGHDSSSFGNAIAGATQERVERFSSRNQDSPERDVVLGRGSRSMRVSVEQTVSEQGSASGSVEVTKKSLRARLEAKTPGDHEIIIPAWVETDAECDYSLVQQALCDSIDMLPDQD